MSRRSLWIATDDDASRQDRRRQRPNDFSSNLSFEATGASTASASSTDRPAVETMSPLPTGLTSPQDLPFLPPGSTEHAAQWPLDLQRHPQTPLPGVDSSSSDQERASPKRRLSSDELLIRGHQEYPVPPSSLRSRRSTRSIRSTSRRSSFTPDRPVNIFPSTSLQAGRAYGATSSSSITSPVSRTQAPEPTIRPPADFATSVSLQQQHSVQTSVTIPAPIAAPVVPEARAVSGFEEELRFLRDQWTSVCITLSSLRSMYLAVSIDTAQQQAESSSAGASSDVPAVYDLPEFPVPSSISVSSFVGMAPPARSCRSTRTQRKRGPRSNKRDKERASNEQSQGERQHYDGIHPDVQHEMLIGYDDAMLQIRQLEFKVEMLEAEIRRLVEEAPDPSRPS